MDFNNEEPACGPAVGSDKQNGTGTNSGNGSGVRGVTEFDGMLGRRLRQARLAGSLTQDELAKKVGISFQQIQKYENGSNRISATRLLKVSRVLGISITFFFDEADMTGDTTVPDRVMRAARDLDAIPDGPVKDQLLQLIKTIGRVGFNAR